MQCPRERIVWDYFSWFSLPQIFKITASEELLDLLDLIHVNSKFQLCLPGFLLYFICFFFLPTETSRNDVANKWEIHISPFKSEIPEKTQQHERGPSSYLIYAFEWSPSIHSLIAYSGGGQGPEAQPRQHGLDTACTEWLQFYCRTGAERFQTSKSTREIELFGQARQPFSFKGSECTPPRPWIRGSP